jgi:hypothetical protein
MAEFKGHEVAEITTPQKRTLICLQKAWAVTIKQGIDIGDGLKYAERLNYVESISGLSFDQLNLSDIEYTELLEGLFSHYLVGLSDKKK